MTATNNPRSRLIRYAILSFLLSLLWNVIAADMYGYNREFVVFLGINLYPLLSWAVGLFALCLIYDLISVKYPRTNAKIWLSIISYWIILVFFEYFFYNVLGIHNEATASYPGLPLCNCMHAPIWMQAAYFLMGVILVLMLYAYEHIDLQKTK
jgi:hypothetical protein